VSHPRLFGNRWRPRALAVVLAAAAPLVEGATAAQAHNTLEGTFPADGAPTTSSSSTPASGSETSSALWWVVVGGFAVRLLLVMLIRTRKPRSTPHDERDTES
jgi:hypothetical protein